MSTWIGSGVPRFYLPLDQIFPQTNVSQCILLAEDLGSARRCASACRRCWPTEFPEVRGRVKLLPNGPPVPYPVQFRVVGPDAAQVRAWADEVKAILRANPNMRGVNDNWNESVKVLRLEIDQDKARALGVTSQAIAQASRTILSGTTIGQYREGDKLIDIVLRQPLDERNAITDLGNAYLPTAAAAAMPLTQIATRRLRLGAGRDVARGPQLRRHRAGRRRRGRAGRRPSRAQSGPQLAGAAARRCRRATAIQIAGAVEESSKGQGSIAAGVPLMLFIMFTLLMLQLHSFSRVAAGVPDRRRWAWPAWPARCCC